MQYTTESICSKARETYAFSERMVEAACRKPSLTALPDEDGFLKVHHFIRHRCTSTCPCTVLDSTVNLHVKWHPFVQYSNIDNSTENYTKKYPAHTKTYNNCLLIVVDVLINALVLL